MKPSLIHVRFSRVAAAVLLPIIGVATDSPPLAVLGGLGILILFAEIMETKAVKSQAAKFEEIQLQLVRLIADLTDLAAGRHDLWVVDIYLPQRKWHWLTLTRRHLVRRMSLTLTDAQYVSPEVEISKDNLLALSYLRKRDFLWWHHEIRDESPEAPLGKLAGNGAIDHYGVILAHPLVDNTGHNCRGVLVVHTKLDEERSLIAVGVLESPSGKRKISATCHDIQRVLD